MFSKEKDLVERSKFLLKNKEARTLKADIAKLFPRLSENEISEIFPNKESISITKLANKTIVYSLKDIPLFYDYLDRRNIFPSIYALWKFPHTLRNIVIHSGVSEYVLRGADLMLPGLSTYNGFLPVIFHPFSQSSLFTDIILLKDSKELPYKKKFVFG